VLLAVGEQLLGDEFDRRLVAVANGFGGGVAGTREELCGALAGGIVLLGYLHGRTDNVGSDDPVYERAKAFRERFLGVFGDTICRKLRDEGPYGPDGPSSCRNLVGEAARILLECCE
jgi:C_GCAxxG_C_C family probable redox protein